MRVNNGVRLNAQDALAEDPSISEESQRQALKQEHKPHLGELAQAGTRKNQGDRQSEVEAKDEGGGGERKEGRK